MRIRNLDRLVSHGNVEGRKVMCEILEAGLQAADPYYNTLRLVKVEDGKLYIGCKDFEAIQAPRSGTDVYDLKKDIDRIFVFGAAKGIQRVALALEEKLGDYLTGGRVIAKHGDELLLKKIQVSFGGHPIPDEDCVEGCKKIVEEIKALKLTERDLVFTIVGNGVSSLLTLPPEGISLSDVKELTRVMQIEKGVSTTELNVIRNQVDQLKGGRITRLLRPAKMVHILTIDCNYGNTGKVGYPGLTTANIWLHTLPDASSQKNAGLILSKWDAWDEIAPSIKNYLANATPDMDVLKAPEFEEMDCRIFGIMPDAIGFIPSAMAKAKELGYAPHLICKSHFLQADNVGRFFGNMAKLCDKENEPFTGPCALFFTGEMLVSVGKNGGVGGRNQECALTAATVLAGNPHVVVGAADTDGTDGPGGVFHEEATKMGVRALSGGVVDGYTMQEAAEKGVDVKMALQTHGTSNALWSLDCGLWATQNISLQDIVVAVVQGKE